MKKRTSKVVLFVVAFLLMGFIMFIADSITGNPISKMLANNSISKYIEKNYSDLNLEVSSVIYNLKFGNYSVFAQSKDSKDTRFSIYSDGKGKIIEDEYDDYVLNGFNTDTRINEEYKNFVEPIIKSKLDFDFDKIIVELKNPKGVEVRLPLDLELDVYNPPLNPQITIYIYTEDVTWENVASTALQLDKLMNKNELDIEKYTIVLEHISVKKDKNGKTIGVYDFPRELLKEKDLPIVMENYFNDWNENNEKTK